MSVNVAAAAAVRAVRSGSGGGSTAARGRRERDTDTPKRKGRLGIFYPYILASGAGGASAEGLGNQSLIRAAPNTTLHTKIPYTTPEAN